MQSTVKRLMPLVFFSFYAFHCGLHSAIYGEKADAFFFSFYLIFFSFSLLILNFFLFSYQIFMTQIPGLTS